MYCSLWSTISLTLLLALRQPYHPGVDVGLYFVAVLFIPGPMGLILNWLREYPPGDSFSCLDYADPRCNPQTAGLQDEMERVGAVMMVLLA